jgi:hypothetical protein
VFLAGQEEEMKLVRSNVEKQIQRAAASRSGGPFESQAVPSDDRQQRKFTAHLNTYFSEVISCIRDAESILIFGPGESDRGESTTILSKSKIGFANRIDTEIPDHVFQADTGIRHAAEYRVKSPKGFE